MKKPQLSFIKPLKPLWFFYLLGLLIFFCFRTALCIEYFNRVVDADNYLLLFPIGSRVDTILLCYLLLLPLLCLFLFPSKVIRKIRFLFSLYFTLLISLFLFMEFATFPFMAEFDNRPDRIFFENIVQVKEVFSMVWQGHRVTVIIGLSVLCVMAWTVLRVYQGFLRSYAIPSLPQRIILLIVTGLLLFFGIRSSFIHSQADVTTPTFSRSHLVNQLGLNSTYSLGYAYYSMKVFENDPRKIYGTMESSEILRRVRTSALIPEEACTNSEIPLLHYQLSQFLRQYPLNLVIIMEESLDTEFVGCLGGLPLTPNIDKLSKEGLLFTNLYCTGTRTDRCIEATISGFLPTPGTSTVKLGLSATNFFTVAELLRRRGYLTKFIYGGRSRYDNMRAFFLNNGVQKIYDKSDCKNPIFSGTWGVSDEDLFNKANEVFSSHGDAPFFALILSTSNHDPYVFPDGRIELYEHPKHTRNNAVKYADYAVGKFFEMAKQERYYQNTLFLIIADHGTRLRGQDLIPIHKFHIPGLLIGPNVTPGKFEKVASQIDMVPTLLEVMGISTTHPLIGRPLLSFPDNIPGRAIMQYSDTNAFMLNNQVIIQRPHLPPAQFTYYEGRLIPSILDSELAKDALAYALLPAFLYYNRLHHLEEE